MEDFYSIDQQVVNDLIKKMPVLKQSWVALDPCAGAGLLADRYTKLTKNKVDMYDICSRREDIIEANYIKLDCKDKYNLIICEFPYQMATLKNPVGFSQLLKKALSDVKPGGYVCSLQRLLYLESKQRYEDIYGKYKPCNIYVYCHRVNCFKNGDLSKKENNAYGQCWVIFHKDEQGFFKDETKLDWIY